MAKERKRSDIAAILDFAGSRKWLTYLGMLLSAVSQLLSFGPYVCIWFVARDLIAVAPNWAAAGDIARYGWWAYGGIPHCFQYAKADHRASDEAAAWLL